MLQRVKWMRVKTELKLNDLYEYFLSKSFNEENGYGFFDVNSNDSCVEAVYVEKESVSLQYTDPFGEDFEQTVISFNQFNFRIEMMGKDIFLLSVTNPPKSIKKFLDRISSRFDYAVTFSLINLDISKILSFLERNVAVTLFKVGRVKVSGLRFTDDSTGCIELVSKGNAMSDLADNVNEKKFVIDKVKATYVINNKRVNFEVSKSGLLSTDGDEEDIFYLSRSAFELV
jgi:hypothetical protein